MRNLNTQGLQMISEALNSMQARKERARAEQAQREAEERARQRYIASTMMEGLTPEKRRAVFEANPQVFGGFNYPDLPQSEQELADTEWAKKSLQGASAYDPTEPFALANIGYSKMTGNNPSAEFTKTIAGREYMDRTDNFGKSLRVGSNIELGATGLEEKRRADRKFLEIERPESRGKVGLLGAQTGRENAGTGKLRAETKTELARLDSTSPVSPGYQPPTSGATGATGTDRKAEQNTRILQSVNSLLGRAGVDTVGVGAWLAKLPATAARDFQADLNTLKANIAFGELQEMRNASKTGGALGQVSERELTLLESSLAGLDQKQSVGNFKKNLQQIQASIARWNAAKGGGGESGVLDVTRDANGRLILPR